MPGAGGVLTYTWDGVENPTEFTERARKVVGFCDITLWWRGMKWEFYVNGARVRAGDTVQVLDDGSVHIYRKPWEPPS